MRNTHPHYEVEAGPLFLSLSPSPKSFKVSLLLHRPDPTNFFLGRLAHSFLLSSSSLLVWRRAHRIMTRRDGAEVSREGEGGSSRERYNIDFESGSGNNCDCKSGLPGPRQEQAGSPLPNSTHCSIHSKIQCDAVAATVPLSLRCTLRDKATRATAKFTSLFSSEKSKQQAGRGEATKTCGGIAECGEWGGSRRGGEGWVGASKCRSPRAQRKLKCGPQERF